MNSVMDRFQAISYGLARSRGMVAEVGPVMYAAEHGIEVGPRRLKAGLEDPKQVRQGL